MIRRIKYLGFYCLFFSFANAQENISISELKTFMKKAYASFDNSFYLSFNANYKYTAFDASNKVVSSQEKQSKYTVNYLNYIQEMDDLTIVQNEEYHLTVLNDMKTILLSKFKPDERPSGTLPKLDLSDAAWAMYAEYYSIRKYVDTPNGTHTYTFGSNNNYPLPYDSISITYFDSSYRTQKMVFFYKQDLPYDENNPELNRIKKQKMEVVFSDYSSEKIDPVLFSIKPYVYFDSASKEFVLAQKYRGWRLITNGLPQNNNPEFITDKPIDAINQ